MQYIKPGSKPQKLASAGVLIGSTITFAIMYSPQPLISLYSEKYHITPATAGLSISLTTIALAVSLFIVSFLSGGLNRKKTMSLSLILTSCLSILSAFVNDFQIFLLIRFLEGISIACFPSLAMAYLNEEFSPDNIGKVMGYYVAGTATGGFTGRLIIGTLSDLTGWHISFLIQGILSLVGSLWFFFYLPESKNFVRTGITFRKWIFSMKKTVLNKNLFSMYITAFLLMGAYITILNYIGYPLTKPPYNLSQTFFGFLFVVNLFGVYSSILFGKLADRYSRRKILGLAILIIIAGVLFTLNHHLIIKIFGVAAVAFGFMAGHSVASSFMGLLAPKDCKGQASSIYLLFYYSGSSLLGWAGGFILANYQWIGLVFYVILLLLFALWITCKPISRLLEYVSTKTYHQTP